MFDRYRITDGNFNYTNPPPQCVRKNTCRQPNFPVHPGFSPNDTSRVFYSFGENIEMKCSDPNLVAEGASIFNKETFSVLCAGLDDKLLKVLELSKALLWRENNHNTTS